jgi:hypothetical protein
LIKKKHRCWTRYRETGDKKKYQEYAKTRNQVKNAIRKAKAIMEKEIAQNANSNPKISGSIVYTLLKKLARTSTFSLSVVVFLSSPSSDLNFSSDIPVLVFLLELAYFQKILGLPSKGITLI